MKKVYLLQSKFNENTSKFDKIIVKSKGYNTKYKDLVICNTSDKNSIYPTWFIIDNKTGLALNNSTTFKRECINELDEVKSKLDKYISNNEKYYQNLILEYYKRIIVHKMNKLETLQNEFKCEKGITEYEMIISDIEKYIDEDFQNKDEKELKDYIKYLENLEKECTK